VRNVGDDRPQGIGDSAMAGVLLLGILPRLVPLPSFWHELMHSQDY
jgi:hypothetical protein